MQGQRSPMAARRKLGAHLRELRNTTRMTGTAVAREVGCAPSTISKIEGANHVPDPTCSTGCSTCTRSPQKPSGQDSSGC